jgi:glycosyltransferase involved in cell wall biosynthesis
MPPYLLMTAAIEPRKNHVTLVRAFESLLARHDTDLCLVIVGRPGWKYSEALQAMKPLIEQGRIIHLMDVPIQELRVLNSHAEAMVFPSLYEGFGYGPLEAMCCRTPAVVSDIAAHRWAYGEAALYFDPYRLDSFVEALEQLLFSDPAECRERLVEAGLERVKLYSAQTVSEHWLALFDELRRQNIRNNVSDARLASFA